MISSVLFLGWNWMTISILVAGGICVLGALGPLAVEWIGSDSFDVAYDMETIRRRFWAGSYGSFLERMEGWTDFCLLFMGRFGFWMGRLIHHTFSPLISIPTTIFLVWCWVELGKKEHSLPV